MTNSSAHEAVIRDGVGYFTFTMGGVRRIDPHVVAAKLLRAEIAETVGSPSDPEVRLSPRYAELSNLLEKIEALQGFARAVESGSALSWCCRHPVHAFRMLNPLRSGRSESTQRDLSSSLESLQESADLVASAVAQEQSINAIQHAIECDVYSPSYRFDEPYLRLNLRPIAVWLSLKDGGQNRERGDWDEGIYANATLLLHRSGVVQLTLALSFPADIAATKFAELQFSGADSVVAAEYPEPLLRATISPRAFRNDLPGEWDSEERAGTRWRRMEYSSPISVADLSRIYFDSISNVAMDELQGAWLCHPSIFINEISCCSSEDMFRGMHGDLLDRLIARYENRNALRGDAIRNLIPVDGSLTVDHSVYMHASHTLSIRWPGFEGAEDYANHLQHVIIAECALLQYWQIRMIDDRVVRSRGRLRLVRELQEDAIYGLREYRASPLVHGTAREASERLLSGWQADRLYQHTLESLNQLQQLVATEDSQRSSRRANTLAATAALAAVVLGLPAVDETLDVAKKIPEEGLLGSIAAPLRYLASQDELGAWTGYLALLLIVSIFVVTRKRRGSRVRLRRKKRAGVSWPLGTVAVVRRGDDSEVQS